MEVVMSRGCVKDDCMLYAAGELQSCQPNMGDVCAFQ